jgi:hypothetical protein
MWTSHPHRIYFDHWFVCIWIWIFILIFDFFVFVLRLVNNACHVQKKKPYTFMVKQTVNKNEQTTSIWALFNNFASNQQLFSLMNFCFFFIFRNMIFEIVFHIFCLSYDILILSRNSWSFYLCASNDRATIRNQSTTVKTTNKNKNNEIYERNRNRNRNRVSKQMKLDIHVHTRQADRQIKLKHQKQFKTFVHLFNVHLNCCWLIV